MLDSFLIIGCKIIGLFGICFALFIIAGIIICAIEHLVRGE